MGLAFLIMALLLTGCESSPEPQKFSGHIMGTTYNVTVVMKPEKEKIAALAEGMHQVLVDVDRKMSTYKPDSELSRFNKLLAGEALIVSADTGLVVQKALELSSDSDGAFDPTVGPLVNLWGFGPDLRPDRQPDEKALSEAFERVGYQAVSSRILGDGRYQLNKSKDIYLDLSAIAKGYGVDKVADYLMQQGYTAFLVEVGGEIRVNGLKPGNSRWRIAIEKPVSDGQVVQSVIGITDISVATSGSYRNYFEEDGQRFSHTIDPETGRPVTHKLASVTVLHEDCALADALATTLMVMGPEKGMAYARKNKLAVYMLVKSDNEFRVDQTQVFSDLVQMQ
ncbi:FAD:protein FMN transferase [Oceanospirillum sp. D5]|uniref:FAD:protein FMN transferase n=2 Tax=Oceanospirillum sediminis TaxID=2760088 RepID=A0A839ITR1_9GAMM|nr:FAD:protein FMN transferase [Oceanospirillum sediminis]